MFNKTPTFKRTYNTRNIDITQFNVYFFSTATEWNDPDESVTNSESFSIFKKIILKFIQRLQTPNNIINCHDPKKCFQLETLFLLVIQKTSMQNTGLAYCTSTKRFDVLLIKS